MEINKYEYNEYNFLVMPNSETFYWVEIDIYK